VLAIQTDNSDTGRDPEWTSLLSGYPLPSGLYAWSMTWPAPEMPRPGCVWTHTLLLDPRDDELCSGYSHLSLFRRPKLESSSTKFEKALEPVSGAEVPSVGRGVNGGTELLTALIWSFYEPPLRPVRATGVPWRDAERHLLLMSLWAQQWAELRARSTFTDSPITPRHFGEAPYDLQLHRTSRAQQRRETQRVVSGVPKNRPPQWANCAARDILKPNGLSAFLHAYGSESGGERATFNGLVNLWALGERKGEHRGRQVLAQLHRLHPKKEAGKRLKADLLASNGSVKGWSCPLGDAEVVLGGLESEDLEVVPLALLDVERRISRILKGRPDELGPILKAIGNKSGPMATQVLESLINAPTRALERWIRADQAAFEDLLRLRPELAASPALWKFASHDRIWAAISGLKGKERRGRALSAMLASEAELDPGLVLAAWDGSEALVLDRIAMDLPRKNVAERWLQSVPPGAIARWINNNAQSAKPQVLRLLFGAAHPQEVAKVDPEIVLDQLELTKSQEFTASVFVAAVNSSRKRKWARPAVLSFEKLCEQKKRLSRKATAYFDELGGVDFKGASWSSKLARPLNLAFQDDVWDPLETLRLSPTTFRLLLAADKKAGLARRVSRAAAERPEHLDSAQSKILLQNIKERSDANSLFEWGEALARKLWPF
jgi:GTPase-associated protein 1, N-terminal domain type 1